MKIRGTQKPFLSLESVALTDIIMNLFIFFFISFSMLYTFNKESKIKVNLPKGATKMPLKEKQPLVVTITAKNEMYFGNNQISEQALRAELANNVQFAKDYGLIIKADKQAAVNYLVKVLDMANQVGINKLGISIEVQKK